MRFNQVGKQIALELYDVNNTYVRNIEILENKILKIAKAINATVISSNFLHFNPYGISGVLIIAESHIAVHTWEEYNYIAIDLFSCDLKLDLDKACNLFIKEFDAKNSKKIYIKRGFYEEK